MAHKHVFSAVTGTAGLIQSCKCGATRGTVNTHELTGEARRQARASARKIRGHR